MAWQLIYTSAPRSLEAGRSGFGTVARHRAISPLLVSAIERTSQFSRLPGVDTGRVIFCHRIVAVAGGRFHVLSAIRDAGADYTGRTNHIAHHLVADPREIAQLGTSGPSPADVLLGMNWVTSWDEPPCYFEAQDEIALASFRPASDASAWQRISGNQDHAWLLASGDASRGAYVIGPAGIDLREVYAESLRLMPERLWQISLTTSLQPSDESSDFRWIGMESESPLLAQAETSGRPVFDLARPQTLPRIQISQAAIEDPAEQKVEPVSADLAPDYAADAVSEAAPFSVRKPGIQLRRQSRSISKPSAQSASRGRNWGIIAGTVVLLLGLIVGAYYFYAQPLLERQEARKKVADVLSATNFYPPEKSVQMATVLVPSQDDARGIAIANASARLINWLRRGDLSAFTTPETGADLETIGNSDKKGLPTDIGKLRETVENIKKQLKRPEDTRDWSALSEEFRRRRTELSTLRKECVQWPGIINELEKNANAQQAKAYVALVQEKVPPPDGVTIARMVADFRDQIRGDAEALKIVSEIEKPETASKVAALPVAPNSPPPSIDPTPPQNSTSVTVAQLSSTPLYFVIGVDGLSNLRISELVGGLSYSIQLGVDAQPIVMKDLTKSGALRMRTAQDKEVFTINVEERKIERGAAAADLMPPFGISGKDPTTGATAFQVWIITENPKPLYSNTDPKIKRNGSLLKLDPALLRLSGTPKNSLFLRLPEEVSKNLFLISKDWTVDLSETLKEYVTQRDSCNQKLADLKLRWNEPPKDDQKVFEELAQKLEASYFKNTKPPKFNTSQERCGEYVKEVAKILKAEQPMTADLSKGSASKVNDTFDKLVEAGSELQAATAAQLEQAVAKVLLNLKKLSPKLSPRVVDLENMLITMDPGSKVKKAKAREMLRQDMEKTQALHSKLESLLQDLVPTGDYCIISKSEAGEIPLVDITVSDSPR